MLQPRDFENAAKVRFPKKTLFINQSLTKMQSFSENMNEDENENEEKVSKVKIEEIEVEEDELKDEKEETKVTPEEENIVYIFSDEGVDEEVVLDSQSTEQGKIWVMLR